MADDLFDQNSSNLIKTEFDRFLNAGGSLSSVYRSFLGCFKNLEVSVNGSQVLSRRPSRLSEEVSPSEVGRRRRSRTRLSHRYNASQISSEIISLETDPEHWKELQLLHLSHFPQTKCNYCERSICFKCGESTWHKGITCDMYLRRRVEGAKGSSNTLATLKWKLAHSRPCPTCHIYINREEGCNKIDCSHCGTKVSAIDEWLMVVLLGVWKGMV